MLLKHLCLGIYERQSDGRLVFEPHPICPDRAHSEMSAVRTLQWRGRFVFEYVLTWHLADRFGGTVVFLTQDGSIYTTLEEVP